MGLRMSGLGSKLKECQRGRSKKKWTDEETFGGVKDEISTPVTYIRNGIRDAKQMTYV